MSVCECACLQGGDLSSVTVDMPNKDANKAKKCNAGQVSQNIFSDLINAIRKAFIEDN